MSLELKGAPNPIIGSNLVSAYTRVKDQLMKVTKCDIQHNGWTCGTCFFAIDERLTNQHWQCILFFRGDYNREDLDNIPETLDGIVDVIAEVCFIIGGC